MVLPNIIKRPSTNLTDYPLFISGDKKVGKTCFCAEFKNHFIFEFEVGNASHISCNYEDVPNLKKFDSILMSAEDGLGTVKVIILDEINKLYQMILIRVCKQQGIQDPGDLPFGKGWRKINEVFDEYINRLHALNCGIIYTSHSIVREFELRSGKKVNKYVPDISKHVKDICYNTYSIGCFVLQFDDKQQRFMQIEGDNFVEAGNGFKSLGKFLRVKEGKILLGSSSSEAFENFINAWNNVETSKPVKIMLGKKK